MSDGWVVSSLCEAVYDLEAAFAWKWEEQESRITGL